MLLASLRAHPPEEYYCHWHFSTTSHVPSFCGSTLPKAALLALLKSPVSIWLWGHAAATGGCGSL